MHKTCLAAFRWGWNTFMHKQGAQVHSHCRKKEEKTVIEVRVLRYIHTAGKNKRKQSLKSRGVPTHLPPKSVMIVLGVIVAVLTFAGCLSSL